MRHGQLVIENEKTKALTFWSIIGSVVDIHISDVIAISASPNFAVNCVLRAGVFPDNVDDSYSSSVIDLVNGTVANVVGNVSI